MVNEISLTPDINVKIRDLEERQRLIKDKLDLLSRNFTDFKEMAEKDTSLQKISTNQLQMDLLKMKDRIIRITEELENRAKKSEVELVAKQLKIMKPLTI